MSASSFGPSPRPIPAACARSRTRRQDDLLREVEEKRLVSRPFRDSATRTVTEGICFCCDDCCGYFLDPEERCDPGRWIEQTDLEACDDCLACVDVCHFGARATDGGTLRVERDRCYGCGLCVDACPPGCVSMVERA